MFEYYERHPYNSLKYIKPGQGLAPIITQMGTGGIVPHSLKSLSVAITRDWYNAHPIDTTEPLHPFAFPEVDLHAPNGKKVTLVGVMHDGSDESAIVSAMDTLYARLENFQGDRVFEQGLAALFPLKDAFTINDIDMLARIYGAEPLTGINLDEARLLLQCVNDVVGHQIWPHLNMASQMELARVLREMDDRRLPEPLHMEIMSVLSEPFLGPSNAARLPSYQELTIGRSHYMADNIRGGQLKRQQDILVVLGYSHMREVEWYLRHPEYNIHAALSHAKNEFDRL